MICEKSHNWCHVKTFVEEGDLFTLHSDPYVHMLILKSIGGPRLEGVPQLFIAMCLENGKYSKFFEGTLLKYPWRCIE